MSAGAAHTALPDGIVELPASHAPEHNRLCVVISDLHCTDGTVGNQSGEEPDWEQFFDQVEHACDTEQGRVHELTLVLNGDIIDLIRTSVWTENGIYPWDRQHPQFAALIVRIMDGIVRQHSNPHGLSGRHGFFVLLRQLRARLQARGTRVRLIPLLGNHDKEIVLVDAARRMLYFDCLGLQAAELEGEWRQWIAAMYGADAPPGETPWLPFYYADRGLRLFVTHGQWRDASNCRPGPDWRLHEGWQPLRWQQLRYAPFIEPCFGDTVAAGLLSGFIWQCGSQLGNDPDNQRLRRMLDEMDLYRPATAGLVRILQEARRLARRGGHEVRVATICETFRACLKRWLAQPMTWRSAPLRIHCFLPLLWLLARLRWEWVTLWVMQLMARVQEPEADIDERTLLTLPAFLRRYRQAGFAIHSEGHTHIALEAELQFEEPAFPSNYCYINTGAWRDRIVRKNNYGYRRRGIGRGLFVFDLAEQPTRPGLRPIAGRQLRYYVRDVTSWGDHLDRL